MKRLRMLTVLFDTDIKPAELSAFRDSIAKKAGPENPLLSNFNSDEQISFGYPLIQYKTVQNKPLILCIDTNLDSLQNFFKGHDWNLEIEGHKFPMKIDMLQLHNLSLNIWDYAIDYEIKNWIALNNENYPKYTKLQTNPERIEFLEDLLKANMLSFAKGVNWMIKKDIGIKITYINDPRPITFKGKTLLGFNLGFKTNVDLPNYIGLGKNVNLGFGIVSERIKDRR